MSDVFLSYASENAPQAERVAAALTAQGVSVWWDRHLDGGEIWRRKIEDALEGAACVVVLWSRHSVESQWVLDEAQEGQRRNVLVPALIESIDIPLGFRQLQAVRLVDAEAGELSEARLPELLRAVALVLKRPIAAPDLKTVVRRRRIPPRWLVGAALAALLGVALTLWSARVAEADIDLDVRATDLRFVSSSAQDLFGTTVVTAFEADGLTRIEVPRGRGVEGRIVTSSNERYVAIRFDVAQRDAPGSITLEPVTLEPGTVVTASVATAPFRYRATIAPSPSRLRATLHGAVSVLVAGEPRRVLDVGAPKPLLLEPSPRAFGLAVADVVPGSNAAPGAFTGPLLVGQLSFTRVDERISQDRTNLSRVSTIETGTLRVAGAERPIGRGYELRMGDAQGEMQPLQVVDGVLRVRFRGRVRELAACVSTQCENWMPRRATGLTR